MTAWDFIGSTGGDTALVDINGQIAGESVNSTKQWAHKYSFSLGEDITGRISRVQNLAITINDGVGDIFVANPGSTVFHNAPGAQPGELGAVDFLYTGNAGTNGHNRTPVPDSQHTGSLYSEQRSVCGKFINGVTDGEALAWAIMDTTEVDLPAGDYTVHFTGIVKDNSGVADLPIDVTQLIHIVHPGCGNNP